MKDRQEARLRSVFALAIAVIVASALSARAQQGKVPTLSTPSDVAASAVSTTQPEMNAGVSPRSPAKSDIQNLLAQVTEAGVGKGEIPTLVGFLSKADRDAIGDVRSKQWADLDGRADEFHQDWQAMFGISFSLTDKQSVVYGDESFPIRPGKEANEHPSSQPVGQAPATDTSAATMPSITQAMGEDPSQLEATTVHTAIVELPATRHSGPIVLHLVNEGTTVPSWKIDLPTTISAQSLHDSLLKHLTRFDDHRANWPTEINEAYQAASREVLASLLDAAGAEESGRH